MSAKFMLIVALLIAVTGCDLSKAPPQLTVGLVDGSCTHEGIEVYQGAWARVLDDVVPGDRVILARITSNAVSLRPDFDETLPAIPFWRDNALEREKRVTAYRARAKAALSAAVEEGCSSRSPVLDALNQTAPFVLSMPGARKRLLVMSDMLEDSVFGKFDERPPVIPGDLLARLRQERALPDFQGAEVWIVGANAPTATTLRSTERFWREYFSVTHGNVTNYGGALAVSRGE